MSEILKGILQAARKEPASKRASARSTAGADKRIKPVVASVGILNSSIIQQNDLIRSSIQVQESQNALLQGILSRTGSSGGGSPTPGGGSSILHDLGEMAVWFIGEKIGKGIGRGIRALRGMKPPLEGEGVDQGKVKILGRTGTDAPEASIPETPVPETPTAPAVAEALKSPSTTDVLGGWLWPMLSIASDSMHPSDEWMKKHGLDQPHVKTIWERIKENSSAPTRASDAEIDQSYKDQKELQQGFNLEAQRGRALGRLPVRPQQQSSISPEVPSIIQKASYQTRVIPSLRFVADKISFSAREIKFKMTAGISASQGRAPSGGATVQNVSLGGAASAPGPITQNAGGATPQATAPATPTQDSSAPRVSVPSQGSARPTQMRPPSVTPRQSAPSSGATPVFKTGGAVSTVPNQGVTVPQTIGSQSYDDMYKQAKQNSSSWGDAGMNPTYSQGAMHGACLRGVGGVLSSLTGDKRLIAPMGGNADSFSLGNRYLQKTGKFADPVSLPKDYMSDRTQWRIGDTVSASMPGHGGHIQTWDGHTWVSDGQQSGILLHAHGQSYQNYTLHRLNTAGAASLSPAYVAGNDSTGATASFIKENSTEIASIRAAEPPKAGTPQPTAAANAGPDVPKSGGEAWNAKNTYVIGDSWGVGVKNAMGMPGSAGTGASAHQVLSMVQGNAIKTQDGVIPGVDPSKVKGQNIMLSSGILNSLSHADQLPPDKRAALIAQVKNDIGETIKTLRTDGAKDIRMMSPDVARADLKSLDIPKIMGDISKDTGVPTFTNTSPTGGDQLHLTPSGFKQFGQQMMSPPQTEEAAAPPPPIPAANVAATPPPPPAPVSAPSAVAPPQAAAVDDFAEKRVKTADGGETTQSKAYDEAQKMKGLRADVPADREKLKTWMEGLDPATTAWCSKFAGEALTKAGIKPPEHSEYAPNFTNWGTKIDPQHAKKGDVMLMYEVDPKTGKRDIGHALIYSGDKIATPGSSDRFVGTAGNTKAPDEKPNPNGDRTQWGMSDEEQMMDSPDLEFRRAAEAKPVASSVASAPATTPPAVPAPAPQVHPEASASSKSKSEQLTDHVDRVSAPKPQQAAKASGGNTLAGNDMLYSLCGSTA